MNNKGQVVFYGMMLGLIIIVLALALSPIGNQVISSARNVSNGDTIGMDCTNSSISNFDKATCTVMDYSLFYFFGGLVLIGGAVFTAKILFS
jgi:hypothetical protein